nr:hypothetical protein [Tanacetum cinerariifolium]
PNDGSGGKFEGGDGNVGGGGGNDISCGGNVGRGGSMAESGRGGVKKMSSTGSKLMVRGDECLEGYIGAGRGEKHLEMMEEPFGNRLEVIELGMGVMRGEGC